MAADNLVPVVGTTASPLRTLADGSGVEWAAGVVCYATTVTGGANVLQVVTPTAGLPVAQQGTWQVGLSAGSAVIGHVIVDTLPSLPAGTNVIGGVTQSGSWTVSVAGVVSVNSTVASGSADSGNPVKVGGVYHAVAPTFVDGNRADLQVDVNGNLKVDVAAGSVSVSNFPATQAVSGTITANAGTGNFATNIAQVGGTGITLGQKVSASSFPVVLASDDIVPVSQSGTWSVNVGASLPAGANTIGAVNVASLPSIPAGANTIGAVNVASLPATPAGTNTIGNVNAIQAGDFVEIGGTTYQVQRANVTATTLGATQIVGAVVGKKIRVLAYSIGPVSAAVNVYFQSHTGPTQLCSTKCFAAAGSGMARGLATFGHFTDGNTNDALEINLSANSTVGVDILYITV